MFTLSPNIKLFGLWADHAQKMKNFWTHFFITTLVKTGSFEYLSPLRQNTALTGKAVSWMFVVSKHNFCITLTSSKLTSFLTITPFWLKSGGQFPAKIQNADKVIDSVKLLNFTKYFRWTVDHKNFLMAPLFFNSVISYGRRFQLPRPAENILENFKPTPSLLKLSRVKKASLQLSFLGLFKLVTARVTLATVRTFYSIFSYLVLIKSVKS